MTLAVALRLLPEPEVDNPAENIFVSPQII